MEKMTAKSTGMKLWEQFNNPSASMWRRGEVGKKLWELPTTQKKPWKIV